MNRRGCVLVEGPGGWGENTRTLVSVPWKYVDIRILNRLKGFTTRCSPECGKDLLLGRGPVRTVGDPVLSEKVLGRIGTDGLDGRCGSPFTEGGGAEYR